MPFDLVREVKTRTRSIQLDKGSLSFMVTDAALSQTQASRRSTSMPQGQENAIPVTPAPKPEPTSAPSTIRLKGVLDVEEAPKLGPWKPMSYDELYSNPIQDSTNQKAKQKGNELVMLLKSQPQESSTEPSRSDKQDPSQEPLANAASSHIAMP
jgi:septin 7